MSVSTTMTPDMWLRVIRMTEANLPRHLKVELTTQERGGLANQCAELTDKEAVDLIEEVFRTKAATLAPPPHK